MPAQKPHTRSDSKNSGSEVLRAASNKTASGVARSASVESSASRQAGNWQRLPTRVPIPGEKPRWQRKKKDRKKGKKEIEQLPTVKEEAVRPKQNASGRTESAYNYERCYPGHPDWKMKYKPEYIMVTKPTEDDETDDETGDETGETPKVDEIKKIEYTDEPFDWDTINNDPDVQLVLVRVPKKMSKTVLKTWKIADPATAALDGGHGGHFAGKRRSYTARWTDLTRPKDELRNDPNLVGEEMLDMDVLLPRKSAGGKLFMAPRGIQRTLTITAEDYFGDRRPWDDEEDTPQIELENEPRAAYPPEMFKSRFLPVGSESAHPFPPPKPIAEPQASSSRAPVAPGSRALRSSKKRDANQAESSAAALSQRKAAAKRKADANVGGCAKEAHEPATKKRKTVHWSE